MLAIQDQSQVFSSQELERSNGLAIEGTIGQYGEIKECVNDPEHQQQLVADDSSK